MRIHPNDFRWYAAYHDEGHHPHVHMMVWSAEPEKGYLTREGIATMRSRMTNAIFHEEMTELYIKKDAAYKESIQTAKRVTAAIYQDAGRQRVSRSCHRTKAVGTVPRIGTGRRQARLCLSAKRGQDAGGRDHGTAGAAPEVAACYEQWWKLKDEIASYYGRNTPPHQPLVQQKEFRTIKNFIIREAETLREPTSVQMQVQMQNRGKPRKTSMKHRPQYSSHRSHHYKMLYQLMRSCNCSST